MIGLWSFDSFSVHSLISNVRELLCSETNKRNDYKVYSLCAIHRHIKIFDSSLFHQLFSQILLYQYVYLMYSNRLTFVVFIY